MARKAMSPEVRAQKCNKIKEVAKKVFMDSDFHNLKMVNITKKMGMSEGTIYSYFPTKETLYLTILIDEYLERFERINQIVQQYEHVDERMLKTIIIGEVETLIDNHLLYIRLMMIQASTLERNVETELSLELKQKVYAAINDLTRAMQAKGLPWSAEEFINTFQTINAIVVGMYARTSLPGEVRDMLMEKQLNVYIFDFKNMTLEAIRRYLYI